MEVFNIFPTTIYVDKMIDHESYKSNFYDVYHKFDYEENDVNNAVSENVGNPLIHHEGCLDPLFEEVISHVRNYTLDVLKYKNIFDYVITKTWLSRSRDWKSIPWHIHACAHISFVYYINVPPKSHKLKFMNPHFKNSLWLGNKEGKYDHLKMIQEHDAVNAETFFIHPPEGHIALFPSTLSHSTEYIEGFEGERLAIVGDVTCVLKKEYLQFSTGFISPQYWKIYQG
tara:strand:+ start:65 stop:748 length:684 start_codon:yes stop_codon:yes gene_type:complete